MQGCFVIKQNKTKTKQKHFSVEKLGPQCNTCNPGRAKACMDLQDYPPLPGKAALSRSPSCSPLAGSRLTWPQGFSQLPRIQIHRIEGSEVGDRKEKQSHRLLEAFTNLIKRVS